MRYNLKSSQGKNEAFPQISKEVPDLKKKIRISFPFKVQVYYKFEFKKES
jgi:hypothetical protein